MYTFIKTNPERFLLIDPSYIATMSDKDLSDYQTPNTENDYDEFMSNNVYSGSSDVLCRKCKSQKSFQFLSTNKKCRRTSNRIPSMQIMWTSMERKLNYFIISFLHIQQFGEDSTHFSHRINVLQHW